MAVSVIGIVILIAVITGAVVAFYIGFRDLFKKRR